MATVAWTNWFNTGRLHSAIEYLSPIQFEESYNQQLFLLRQVA